MKQTTRGQTVHKTAAAYWEMFLSSPAGPASAFPELCTNSFTSAHNAVIRMHEFCNLNTSLIAEKVNALPVAAVEGYLMPVLGDAGTPTQADNVQV